jgi:hypothetical protein
MRGCIGPAIDADLYLAKFGWLQSQTDAVRAIFSVGQGE